MIFTQEAPLTRKWFSGRSCIRSNWNLEMLIFFFCFSFFVFLLPCFNFIYTTDTYITYNPYTTYNAHIAILIIQVTYITLKIQYLHMNTVFTIELEAKNKWINEREHCFPFHVMNISIELFCLAIRSSNW